MLLNYSYYQNLIITFEYSGIYCFKFMYKDEVIQINMSNKSHTI